MKSVSINESSREAYWSATRSELQSVRRRGDVLIFIATLALLAIIVMREERSANLNWWIAIGAALLATITAVLWFVTKRRRSIAASRGLVCTECGYVPHDTEITEVADLRECPRCAHSLAE